MATVVIRDLPPRLHQRLKEEAHEHHRSMNREVISIIEKQLDCSRPFVLPPPIKLKRPMDPRWIVDIIREARDSTS